jgi:GNAT superfamily N-acetyltransferase
VPYPRVALERDIEGGVVRTVLDGDDTVATYMLRAEPVHAYEWIKWANADATARYLNRLAVHPSHQGKGVGRWCLNEIVATCQRDGIGAMRCDVLTANRRLCAMYERAGYAARGERSHSGWDFTVFENLITDNG